MFSLKTHRIFGGADGARQAAEKRHGRSSLALATLGSARSWSRLWAEVLVESLQQAAVALGMTDCIRGLCHRGACRRRGGNVVRFLGARKDRLDLSVAITLGSTSQIALFVAPVAG